MTSEYLTARAGAAHNGCTRSLATCLHFQGCLCGLTCASCIKPSAVESDPGFLHGDQPQRLPQVSRGRCTASTFIFTNSFVLLMVLLSGTVHRSGLWIPCLDSLESDENMFNPLCQLFQSSTLAFFIKIRLKKNELHASCEEGMKFNCQPII